MTAQQLITAASLLDLSEDLVRLSIMLAFGALIFNNILNLPERIPRTFLGEEFENVVSNIEHLIQDFQKYKTTQQEAAPTLELFRAVLPKIESRDHETFASNPNIDTVPSRYLSRDIAAALKLGDPSFMNSELDCVKGLLVSTQVPKRVLREFLQSYYQAVDKFRLSGNCRS